ncbi:MAG TPA: hypothetical protein VFZ28_04945 [Burkholderiaceae bacterium]|nr:hypothetical protein [Burkholderiaceae bacterium]
MQGARLQLVLEIPDDSEGDTEAQRLVAALAAGCIQHDRNASMTTKDLHFAGRTHDQSRKIVGRKRPAVKLDPQTAAYLREALLASTHAVFLGLLIAAVASALLLVALVPRQFPQRPEPAGGSGGD